jgi:hypothetical protein
VKIGRYLNARTILKQQFKERFVSPAKHRRRSSSMKPQDLTILSRLKGRDYRLCMDWITEFIGYSHTPIGTTSNYRATHNLHICVLISRSLATAFNGGDSSASRVQVILSPTFQPYGPTTLYTSGRLLVLISVRG